MKVSIGKFPKKISAKQKISIRIDPWDTWNMDQTLAHIILPMLKQLKASKHGSPGSIPFFQQTSQSYPQICFPFYAEEDNYAWDAGHREWNEIMDKMIWSFEQVLNEDWDEQFWTTRPQIDWDDFTSKEGLDENGCKEVKWKVEGKCDWKGREAFDNRIKEGLELFGKYYRDLWD